VITQRVCCHYKTSLSRPTKCGARYTDRRSAATTLLYLFRLKASRTNLTVFNQTILDWCSRKTSVSNGLIQEDTLEEDYTVFDLEEKLYQKVAACADAGGNYNRQFLGRTGQDHKYILSLDFFRGRI